jgi:hypothetical protein
VDMYRGITAGRLYQWIYDMILTSDTGASGCYVYYIGKYQSKKIN